MDHTHLLIKQIREGNQQAFTELITPLIAKAYRTSYAILRSEELAEETVQMAMIEAYRNIISRKDIRKFASWFNQLTASRALDLIRQRQSHQNKLVNMDDVLLTEQDSTIDRIIDNEAREEMIDKIQSIENESYRQVLILYYYQDLSVSEISKVLNANEFTVKTHLRRAREALGKKINLKNEFGVI